VRALAELPVASALVGLALDFSTNLRCANARYFQHLQCEEPTETTCKAQPKHTLCRVCANIGCRGGCDRCVCTLCPRQVMECSECHETVGVCRQSDCDVNGYQCCSRVSVSGRFVCASCINRASTCATCSRALCPGCEVGIQCVHGVCRRELVACDNHIRAYAMDERWEQCECCSVWECNECADADGNSCDCGAVLCNACTRVAHCKDDHRFDVVVRHSERKRKEPADV